jgi:hypothetical protein
LLFEDARVVTDLGDERFADPAAPHRELQLIRREAGLACTKRYNGAECCRRQPYVPHVFPLWFFAD